MNVSSHSHQLHRIGQPVHRRGDPCGRPLVMWSPSSQWSPNSPAWSPSSITSVTTLNAPLQYSSQPSNRQRWLRELSKLLSYPTISAQPRHRRDIEAAALWLKEHLTRLGLRHAQILPGPNRGHPSVYADWLLAPGRPTLLFYGHYDVQPVDPLRDWHTPPFQATRIGQNLFSRGASDDKGQLFIHFKAIESYLKTVGSLPINIKIWLEGEEEINSPNLSTFLDREATRLQADAVLVSDTEMLGQGRPSIIYGLRGNLNFELEVSGPRHDLHSGRYGGAVHNPLQALCEMIAGLHDGSGRVTIPGFYQRVQEVSPTLRQELRCTAPADEDILAELDIPRGWGEKGYNLFECMTIRPALTVNGVSGGYVGPGSKSVIPRKGVARLSMRLVPDQSPSAIAHLLRWHIAAIKPPAVSTRLKITGGSPPIIIPRRHPAIAAAARAIYHTWGVPPVFTRSGGTIPVVSQLQQRFAVPIILLGFGLPDDDIHAPNEKISLPNLFRGVETIIRFLQEYRL
jgi:acetylornithine deacetylase/succinyl-diaminopimelate desuccinylase-like protein